MSKFFKGLKRGFQKVGKGIKRGAEKLAKGTKMVVRAAKKVARETGLDKALAGTGGGPGGLPSPKELQEMKKMKKAGKKQTFGQAFEQGFLGGMSRTGKQLLAPLRVIQAVDPLKRTKFGKKLGSFSPIQFGAEVATAPVSAVGRVLENIGDKKERDKLIKGDGQGGRSEKILDFAFAPIAVGGGGAITKGAKRGARAVAGLF
jgi:hypothetical protein